MVFCTRHKEGPEVRRCPWEMREPGCFSGEGKALSVVEDYLSFVKQQRGNWMCSQDLCFCSCEYTSFWKWLNRRKKGMTIVWGPTAEWQLKKPLLSFSQSTIKCCSSPVVSDRTLKFSPVPEELPLSWQKSSLWKFPAWPVPKPK